MKGTYYNCTFGPDVTGEYNSEIVDSGVKENCGAFCSCVGLLNNTCHFGPDKEGRFETKIVSSELADKCDMTFCTCDTHNYTRMNEERLEMNPTAQIITFDSVM